MDWCDKSVLVIDDEQHMRWLLATLLRHRGATVHLAGDARTGLLRLDELRPDLVILDILLPGMNGQEALRIMRRTSNVPVIVLTSINKSDHIAQCLDLGADGYVTKPFDREMLLTRCAAALRRNSTPIQNEARAANRIARESTMAGAHHARVASGASW